MSASGRRGMIASDNHVEPLKPGETTTLTKPAGSNCILIVDQSGRQIDCGTDDLQIATEFQQRLKGGITIRDPRLLRIEDILNETYPGLEKLKFGAGIRGRHIKFWKGMRVLDITPTSTEAYCDEYGDEFLTGTLRNDLKAFQQYINLALSSYGCSYRPNVTLPWKGSARQRWLTRSEFARMLLAARGWQWEWDPAKRRKDASGRPIPWKLDDQRRPILRAERERDRRKFVTRLLMMGLYTATRCGKILEATWSRSDVHAYIDEQIGVFARRGEHQRGSANKLAPPVTLLPNLRLMMFGLEIRNPGWRPGKGGWRGEDQARGGISSVLHQPDGAPRPYMWNVWKAVRKDAGLGRDVVIHTLRHTAATWLLEAGMSDAEVANFLGITPEILMATYAQVDTKFTAIVAEAVDRSDVGRLLPALFSQEPGMRRPSKSTGRPSSRSAHDLA